MTGELIELIKQKGGGGLIAVTLVLVLSIVEVSKIKFNPWSMIVGSIGRTLNKDVMDELRKVKEEVDKASLEVRMLKKDFERTNAVNARVRILHFGDEILHDEKHTKEHFDQVLRDCNLYCQYCEEHKDFENHVAVQTIKLIEDTYRQHMENRDFL